MALVQCPECGKEVSSNAKQCIHCGCSFTVCPDCGHVALGALSSCPKCGCVLNNETVSKNIESEEDIVGKFRVYVAKFRKTTKMLGIIAGLMFSLAVILLIVEMTLLGIWYFEWQNAGIEKYGILLLLEKNFHKYNLMTVFACIVLSFMLIYIASEHCIDAIRFKSVMKCKKESIPVYFKKIRELAYNEEANETEYRACMMACYKLTHPEYPFKSYIVAAVNAFMYVLTTVFFTVCISQNVKEFMLSTVQEQTFSFQYIWAIIGGIMLIASIIVAKITAKKENANLEEWVQEMETKYNISKG